MGNGGLPSELLGARGSRVYKRVKHRFAHLVGRAFWFDHLAAAVEYSMDKHQGRQRPLSYFEFGTGSGSTLQRALSVLKAFPESRVYLFDSFTGLPPAASNRDALHAWKEGDFAFSEEYIRELIDRNGFSQARVQFHKGFFEQSLTPELFSQLRSTPPAFVTLDVDYYSSTRAALQFLMPMLVSGATFYFDDLWSFDGHPEYGQIKAISEFNDQCKAGQLIPNPIFGNRIYTYYNHHYEFASSDK